MAVTVTSLAFRLARLTTESVSATSIAIGAESPTRWVVPFILFFAQDGVGDQNDFTVTNPRITPAGGSAITIPAPAKLYSRYDAAKDMYIWVGTPVNVPTGTTATFNATMGDAFDSMFVGLAALEGYDGTSTITTAFDGFNASTTPSLSINVPAGGAIIAAGQIVGDSTAFTWTGVDSTPRATTTGISSNTATEAEMAAYVSAAGETGRTITMTPSGGGTRSLALIAFGPASANVPPGVDIQDLKARRIIQRTTATTGVAPVRATYTGTVSPTSAEARVMQSGTQVLGWTALSNLSIANGVITGDLPGVPLGIGYNREIRTKDSGGNVLASDTEATTWGVGSLYAMVGSSSMNKLGGSSAPSVALNTKASGFYISDSTNVGVWTGADMGAGARTIANALIADDPSIPVGLWNSGSSGTTLTQWLQDGNADWVKFLEPLIGGTSYAKELDGKLEGVILGIGGNDVRSGNIGSYTNHITKLRNFIAKIRAALGQPDLKFYIYCLQRSETAGAGTDADWMEGTRAEYDLLGDANVFLGSITNDLSIGADQVHLEDNEYGYKVAGRFARSILANQRGRAVAWKGPKATGVSYNATTGIATVTFLLNFGDSLVGRTSRFNLAGFTASTNDFASLLTISSATIVSNTTVELQLPTGLSNVKVRYMWGLNPVPDEANVLYNNASAP